MTIAISPTSLPEGQTGSAYSQTLAASGGTGPYTFALTSGALPVGLSLSSAGVISGTPTATGTTSFTVTATDSLSATGSWSYTLTIVTLTVTPATLPNASKDSAYSETLTASGGAAPYTFTLTSGTLPGGLTLSSSGLISGTPTDLGSSTFTVTVTDSGGASGSVTYTLVVSGSVYWFICTNAAVPQVPHHSDPQFNRKAASALTALIKSRSLAGHMIARPTPDPFNGHLLCDGSEIGRTDFPQLFEAIGTTWGVGDGTTTFNIPNLVVTPFPVATSVPTQTVTPTTVSSSTTTVSTPSGEGSTGGSTGGNVSSGGRSETSLDEGIP